MRTNALHRLRLAKRLLSFVFYYFIGKMFEINARKLSTRLRRRINRKMDSVGRDGEGRGTVSPFVIFVKFAININEEK